MTGGNGGTERGVMPRSVFSMFPTGVGYKNTRCRNSQNKYCSRIELIYFGEYKKKIEVFLFTGHSI